MSLEHKKEARKAEAGLGSRVKPTGETNEATRIDGIAKEASRESGENRENEDRRKRRARAAGEWSISLPKLFS